MRAILGGCSKGGGFAGLAAAVAERCAACYLIGEAARALERDLGPAWEAGVEPPPLRRARRRGRCRRRGRGRRARSCCSPRRAPASTPIATSSERGEHFRDLVEELGSSAGKGTAQKGAPSIEYSLLLTATLCLLAFGVVMVFSASSTTSLLGQSGDSAYYLKRTLVFGASGC